MFHPKGPSFFELVKQALSSTERGYDLLAPKFDYTPFRTPDAILEVVASHVGTRGSVGSALDVCCGTGVSMRMLRPLCRDAVVGVDFSKGMLKEARQRLTDTQGLAVIHLVRSDVLAMPFRRMFDVVTCFGGFGHILSSDEERFVTSVASALKPRGRFVFVTSVMPPLWSRRYWLSRGFNAATRIRNALLSPPFIMYYLTFLLPDARNLLEHCGFRVEVHEGLFDPPLQHAWLVIATLLN